MKLFRFSPVLCLGLLFALPLTGLTRLSAQALTADAQTTLTRGSGTTTLTSVVENPDGTLSLEAEQAGSLRHFGAFNGTVSYVALITENSTLLTGEGTFTFSSGDQLRFRVTIIEFGSDYPLPFVGVLAITGGTGRFSGARGFLEIDGIDEEDPTDDFHLNGVIATRR